MIRFCERLKELRLEKELLQRELAEALDFSQRTVSNWELGTREPDLATLAKLAKFFDVTTDYLLGVEDYIHIDKK